MKKEKINKKLSLQSANNIVFKKKNKVSQIQLKGLTPKTTSKVTYKVTKGSKYVKINQYGEVTCKASPAKKAKKAVIKVVCGKKAVFVQVTIKR